MDNQSSGEGGPGAGGEATQGPSGPRLARFSCWCPKVIQTIKHLPRTVIRSQ